MEDTNQLVEVCKQLCEMCKTGVEEVNKTNKRLYIIIWALAIGLFVTVTSVVLGRDAIYYLSDYQYPEQSQEVKQVSGNTSQTVQQNLK